MALVLPPLLWFMPQLIVFVYGERYEPAGGPARVILLAAALQLIWGWTKSFPISIGRPALRMIAHGAEIAVLVPLTLVLGAKWGAEGGAIAVLVSTAAFAAVWTVILLQLRRSPLTPVRRGSDPIGDEAVAP